MKYLRSEGKYDVQLLAVLTLESGTGNETNNTFFDMWKRMLKKDFEIDLGQITLPQLKKELRVKVNKVEVVLTDIKSSTYKIRVWKPTYTLITSLE